MRVPFEVHEQLVVRVVKLSCELVGEFRPAGVGCKTVGMIAPKQALPRRPDGFSWGAVGQLEVGVVACDGVAMLGGHLGFLVPCVRLTMLSVARARVEVFKPHEVCPDLHVHKAPEPV